MDFVGKIIINTYEEKERTQYITLRVTRVLRYAMMLTFSHVL